jgi:hypothetical protein
VRVRRVASSGTQRYRHGGGGAPPRRPRGWRRRRRRPPPAEQRVEDESDEDAAGERGIDDGDLRFGRQDRARSAGWELGDCWRWFARRPSASFGALPHRRERRRETSRALAHQLRPRRLGTAGRFRSVDPRREATLAHHADHVKADDSGGGAVSSILGRGGGSVGGRRAAAGAQSRRVCDVSDGGGVEDGEHRASRQSGGGGAR